VRELLLFGLDSTHSRVLKCLDDVTEDEARRLPSDLSPIVWQAGHVATTDFAFARRAGGQTPIPANYEALFQMGTGGHAAYPSMAEVRGSLDRAQQILMELAKTANLDAPVEGRSYSTVGQMLVFAAYHRGYHVGKMTTLRALLKKPRLFG
jgi:DinB superfamily